MAERTKQPHARALRPRQRSPLPLILLLLILVPVAVLWPVVRAEFISLDDPDNVWRNPRLNPATLAGVAWYWTHPYLNMYAPLTYSAWAAVAKLAWTDAVDATGSQLNPYVFHTVNLLVHVTNVLLVFALLRKLLRRESAAPGTSASPRTSWTAWAACLGALLFALHPMQVEPVAWVTGFRDLLAGLFALASLLAYLMHATRSGRARVAPYVLSCACLLAALLCKPTSVVVPLLAAALDWGVLRRPLREVVRPVAGLLVIAVPFALLARFVQSAALTQTPPLWARAIIAMDALAFYLMKLALPLRLGLDYGRSPTWLLNHPAAWVTAGLVVLVALALLWVLRRQRWLLACALVFVAALLPVLGLTKFDFQHHSTVADRYVYLAMLGPAILLAELVRRAGRGAVIVAAVILVLLAARSHLQAQKWKNGAAIYGATLAVNRHSVLANAGMGRLARSRGQWELAERYFATALRTRADDAVVNFDLGTLYLGTHRPAKAVPHLRIAAAVHREPWVATNLANALAQSGELSEAERVLEAALSDTPDSPELHATLAAVLFRRGDRAGAIGHFREALRLKPDFKLAAQELAALEHTPTTSTATTSTSPTKPATAPVAD